MDVTPVTPWRDRATGLIITFLGCWCGAFRLLAAPRKDLSVVSRKYVNNVARAFPGWSQRLRSRQRADWIGCNAARSHRFSGPGP
jgi:hypothetical protein